MAPEIRAAALAALLAGCGVAGRPLPPGPTPPSIPWFHAVDTADGVLLVMESIRDVDGEGIREPVELWLYPAGACRGAPIARGDSRDGVRVPPAHLGAPLQLVAVRGDRVGPPTEPLTATWTPPPPPPEAPLAFVDARHLVQISWLPPGPPVETIRIERDGIDVIDVPAESATWADDPPPGVYRYRIVGLGETLRTGPSAEVEVRVDVQAERAPRDRLTNPSYDFGDIVR